MNDSSPFGQSDLKKKIALVLSLAVSQIIGWATTYSAPAVLARPISETLGGTVTEAMAGSSVFLVAMAFASQPVGRFYKRIGAANVMAIGSVLTASALALVALSGGYLWYWGVWLLIGIGGAAVLSTSAYTVMVSVLGRSAKSWIAGVMLISGLSASIGYPATAFLEHLLGWKGAFLCFASLHLFVCLPLHLLASSLSRRDPSSSEDAAAAPDPASRRERMLFINLALAVSLIGFVTWGFAIVIVELFQVMGLTDLDALALSSAIGIFQVGARALEFTFARNRSSVRTALDASALMTGAFILLLLGSGWSFAAIFVVLYGLASGVMSVARSTMPLELFDPGSYGTMMARLALPMHLAFAAAPALFSGMLEHVGAEPALLVAFGLTALSFLCLWNLRRLAML